MISTCRPAVSSSSVHPLGTNQHPLAIEDGVSQHPLDVQSREQLRLHARHAGPRRRLVTALWNSGCDALARKARKLADCCQTPFIATRTDGSAALLLGCCRDRLCPHCQKAKAAAMAKRTLALVQSMNARRFATFTIASSDAPLADQLGRMLDALRALRRHEFWKRRVTGGIWAIEVTFNPQTGQWHPHLHCVLDGDYLPHPELKAAWLSVTGDSSVVDIRAVRDARDAARYISTYVGKLADLSKVPDARIAEYALALHRRRLAGTFGSCHATSLQHKDDGADPKPANRLLAVYRLSNAAFDGNAAAAEAVAVFCQLGPRWCSVFGEHWPPGRKLPEPSKVPGVARALAFVGSLAASLLEPDNGQTPPPPRPPPPPLLPFYGPDGRSVGPVCPMPPPGEEPAIAIR